MEMDFLVSGRWRGYLPTLACIWAGRDADKLSVFVSSTHSIAGPSYEMVEEKPDLGKLSVSEIRARAEAAFSHRFTNDTLRDVRPLEVFVTTPDAASQTDVDGSATILCNRDAKAGQRLYLTILLEKEREYQQLRLRHLQATRRQLKRQEEALRDASVRRRRRRLGSAIRAAEHDRRRKRVSCDRNL